MQGRGWERHRRATAWNSPATKGGGLGVHRAAEAQLRNELPWNGQEMLRIAMAMQSRAKYSRGNPVHSGAEARVSIETQWQGET